MPALRISGAGACRNPRHNWEWGRRFPRDRRDGWLRRVRVSRRCQFAAGSPANEQVGDL